MIDISEYQHRVYLDKELPALRRLIKNKAQNYGSISALISVMNRRLSEKGWPVFSSNEIAGLRREREQTRDGWSDKLIYRLAVGLGIDADPRWGYLALKLLFLGLWDGQNDGFIEEIKLIAQGKPLSPERVTLSKIQASLPDLSKKNLIELIKQAANQLENHVTHGPLNLAAFVDALCEDYPSKIDELFSSSSLNVQRWMLAQALSIFMVLHCIFCFAWSMLFYTRQPDKKENGALRDRRCQDHDLIHTNQAHVTESQHLVSLRNRTRGLTGIRKRR